MTDSLRYSRPMWGTGWLFGNGSFDEVDLVRRNLSGPGVLVDVGAHTGSTAAPFVAAGWRVFALEPDPANRAKLTARFAGIARVTIDARAVSEVDGDEVELYTSAISTGITPLAPFHASHTVGAVVETVRLSSFCETNSIDRIDLLKIDTEGFDLLVLRSHDWGMLPGAVVCEFEDRKTTMLGYTMVDLGAFLVDHGYHVLVSEWHPVVEYGREHRWRRVFPWGEEEVAPGAWGNLIACQSSDAFDDVVASARREARGADRRWRARKLARGVLRR